MVVIVEWRVIKTIYIATAIIHHSILFSTFTYAYAIPLVHKMSTRLKTIRNNFRRFDRSAWAPTFPSLDSVPINSRYTVHLCEMRNLLKRHEINCASVDNERKKAACHALILTASWFQKCSLMQCVTFYFILFCIWCVWKQVEKINHLFTAIMAYLNKIGLLCSLFVPETGIIVCMITMLSMRTPFAAQANSTERWIAKMIFPSFRIFRVKYFFAIQNQWNSSYGAVGWLLATCKRRRVEKKEIECRHIYRIDNWLMMIVSWITANVFGREFNELDSYGFALILPPTT